MFANVLRPLLHTIQFHISSNSHVDFRSLSRRHPALSGCIAPRSHIWREGCSSTSGTHSLFLLHKLPLISPRCAFTMCFGLKYSRMLDSRPRLACGYFKHFCSLSVLARAELARSSMTCRIYFMVFSSISSGGVNANPSGLQRLKRPLMTWKMIGALGSTRNRRKGTIHLSVFRARFQTHFTPGSPSYVSCGTPNTPSSSANPSACQRLNSVQHSHAIRHSGKPTQRNPGSSSAKNLLLPLFSSPA